MVVHIAAFRDPLPCLNICTVSTPQEMMLLAVEGSSTYREKLGILHDKRAI